MKPKITLITLDTGTMFYADTTVEFLWSQIESSGMIHFFEQGSGKEYIFSAKRIDSIEEVSEEQSK